MFARLELRVGWRAGDPEPPAFIPADLHRADDAEGFVGEEIHLEAGTHLETSQLLGRRRCGWVSTGGEGGGRRRRRLPGRERPDGRVGVGQHRLMLTQFVHETRVVGRGFGERLRGPIAVGEGPVHAAPSVEPEAVLGDDGGAERCRRRGATGQELVGDGGADEASAVFREVKSVAGERLARA